jgi:arsenical pump membrane protein
LEVSTVLIWLIAAATVAGILFRPRGWPEAVWACIGASLLVVFRLIAVSEAGLAIAKGFDVYLFLAGMMLLADLARHEGLFDWMADKAVNASRGSPVRLFASIYAVGILVTVFLSNDATAVVLTPAVYSAVRKARVNTQPCLFACAFIANAASFVLPISNPANLVVYGSTLPPLLVWLRVFALPSLVSIVITYAASRAFFRKALRGAASQGGERVVLSRSGRHCAYAILATGAVLMGASAFGFGLGLPTFVTALAAVMVVVGADWRSAIQVAREVSWSVLPLVAGLFVVVEAMNGAGASGLVGAALQSLDGIARWSGTLAASFGVAALSNLVNNLPSGLLAGSAVRAAHISPQIRDAVLIGVDLGPNLSVTGSLATILWLIALRREGEAVSTWAFLKAGAVVMIPALLLSTLALLI